MENQLTDVKFIILLSLKIRAITILYNQYLDNNNNNSNNTIIYTLVTRSCAYTLVRDDLNSRSYMT